MPVKNEEEDYEKIMDMTNNNDFKKNYKLIAIDLSKQSKLKDPQQTNFFGKFKNQDHWATMFFINQKSEKTTFNLLQNSVTII